MYRFLALVFVFAAAACGGGDAPANSPFGKSTATTGPTQAVLGVREQPSATATAQPTAPSSYVVAEGDTLSEIAAKFNTDTATLVAANNLADADALFVGQELKIAVAGTVTATPAASPTSTPTQ